MNALLETAKEKIEILADVAGYGCLSAHNDFERYVTILREKRDAKCSISIAVYDDDSYCQFVQPLFNRMTLDRVKNDPNYAPYWDYLEQAWKVHRADVRTLSEFKDRLLKDEQHWQRSMPPITGHIMRGLQLPVHCWIVDGKKAIFTLVAPAPSEDENGSAGQGISEGQPAYRGVPDDQSFETSHRQLIRGLQSMIKAYVR